MMCQCVDYVVTVVYYVDKGTAQIMIVLCVTITTLQYAPCAENNRVCINMKPIAAVTVERFYRIDFH
jgi:hypothetical protein